MKLVVLQLSREAIINDINVYPVVPNQSFSNANTPYVIN